MSGRGGGGVKTLTQLRLEKDMAGVEQLQAKNRRYETKLAALQLESMELQKKKNAILTMQEKLRKQLHFKSLVSSKIYYGLDCDKQMQENVKVQLRLLEHEFNRKRNYCSDMAHKNQQLQEAIDEYRLQKLKMRESGQELEAKFADAQEEMRARMATANTLKLTNHKIEDAVEQLTLRAEVQINEQSEEIVEMRRQVGRHQQQAAEIDHASTAKQPSTEEMLQAGLLSLAEEQEMRQRMRMLRHGIVDEAKRVEDSARRIMNHEMAFERLRQETGLSNLGEIVELFVSREDDNFSVYNHLQRVEATLQQAEQKLREVQNQAEDYLESAKTRQGSTSSKFKALERQRDQLRAKLRAQQQVKQGLQNQQGQWNSVLFDFLRLLAGCGLQFESKLLQQPATVAVLDQVREYISENSSNNAAAVDTGDAAAAARGGSSGGGGGVHFVDSSLEVALSIIEQCTSELLAQGVPLLRSNRRAVQMVNRHGMPSPPSRARMAASERNRWNVDPPSFAALELEEDGKPSASSTRPFDSSVDRAALVAAITKKSMEKGPRRGGGGGGGNVAQAAAAAAAAATE